MNSEIFLVVSAFVSAQHIWSKDCFSTDLVSSTALKDMLTCNIKTSGLCMGCGLRAVLRQKQSTLAANINQPSAQVL